MSKNHYIVIFTRAIAKSAHVQKTVYLRNLPAIDVQAFMLDIVDCPLLHSSDGTADGSVSAPDDELRTCVNMYPLLRTNRIMLRPSFPCNAYELHQAKHLRR